MKKDCSTCEFTSRGRCLSHDGLFGYGTRVMITGCVLECWQISFEYFVELIQQLPDHICNMVLYDDRWTKKKILALLD